MAYDTQPSALSGAKGEFIHARGSTIWPRVMPGSRRSSTPASAAPASPRAIVVLYDHEEVGSRSAQGAAGSFLAEWSGAASRPSRASRRPQGLARALSRPGMVSADMAHAVHPNYADRHEPGHRPVIGAGPVIKVNVEPVLRDRCRDRGRVRGAVLAGVGVEPQHFVSPKRSGLWLDHRPDHARRASACARSTSATRCSSMHTCREMAGTTDVEPMIDVLTEFFRADDCHRGSARLEASRREPSRELEASREQRAADHLELEHRLHALEDRQHRRHRPRSG